MVRIAHRCCDHEAGVGLAGGGEDGAFGAGLLVGWTDAGTRPEFKVVTGISTGALGAPFPFLGPRYDEQLKAVYTTINAKDVFKVALMGMITSLWPAGMSNTPPSTG